MGGFNLLLHRPPLLLLTTMAAALAFFGWPLLSLLPALSDRVLRRRDGLLVADGRGGRRGAARGAGGGVVRRQWRRR